MGEQSALLLCHHNSFVMIINAALGGEGNSSSGGPGQGGVKDIGSGYASAEDAAAAINRAMAF